MIKFNPIEFRLNTWVDENQAIVQETINDYREVIWRRILDTSDKAVREVLIDLGWTPPKEGE